MIEITKDNFDLAQICESGQCFRMLRTNDGSYSIITKDHYLEARQDGNACTFYCEEEEFETLWKHYFDLDTDYSAYISKIDSEDNYLLSAAKFGSGIRILNQDLWEMIVSAIISQQNNIARIRRCIDNICIKYGEKKITADGMVFYTFPGPEALAELDEDALMECNLGYRSKYVVRSAKSVASGEVRLNELKSLSYPAAREELLKLYGVGGKVADCICLFALHQLEAFPVDTHIKQAFDGHYQDGFPYDKYDGFQGVMQQYIFYYELFGAQTPDNNIIK